MYAHGAKCIPEAPALRLPRVVVIDDSVVARTMISRILADDHFNVISAFDRADRAIAWLVDHPVDIVLLDIELPGRSGLVALPDLLDVAGGAQIVILSSSAEKGAAVTLAALSLGAADAIAKPAAADLDRGFAALLCARLRALSAERHPSGRDWRESLEMRQRQLTPVSCVAIGASTGGLPALAAFFAALPASFHAPILVTQHLPAAFMTSFSGQLQALSNRPVVAEIDGAQIRSGHIYLAPGDAHLVCESRGSQIILRAREERRLSSSLPSVDVMFCSVANAFGSTSVGVVLSGMGRDGVEGATALVSANAEVIVQDSHSAVIWGMPGVVARAGLASVIAAPAQLAEHLAIRGSKT